MSSINNKQTTLNGKISFNGVGLHTGKSTKVTLCPAEANHGYKFQRTDVENDIIIEADCDLVTDTSRGTTLEKEGVSISTVEHVLAALVGCEVDNALIQIDGPMAVHGVELQQQRVHFRVAHRVVDECNLRAALQQRADRQLAHAAHSVDGVGGHVSILGFV